MSSTFRPVQHLIWIGIPNHEVCDYDFVMWLTGMRQVDSMLTRMVYVSRIDLQKGNIEYNQEDSDVPHLFWEKEKEILKADKADEPCYGPFERGLTHAR